MPKGPSDPLARAGGDFAQGTLFALPAPAPSLVYGGTPPSQATDTSRAAAAKQSDRAPSKRERVLAFVRSQGQQGATAEEATEHLIEADELPDSAFTAVRLGAGARLTELKLAGFVEDSGQRRPTRAGCAGIVWRATVKQGDGRTCERA